MAVSNALKIIVENDKLCTPCKAMEKRKDSAYFCTDCDTYVCEECFNFHQRVPNLAKHIVLKHGDIEVWSKLKYKCTTHDKNLEFFCGEHKLLCCHVCVSLKHRSCSNIEYILESAKDICGRDEIKTMIQRTEENLEQIESHGEQIKRKSEINQKSRIEYIKKLDEYRNSMNKLFDTLMKLALDEMNERFEKNTKYSEEMTRDLKQFEKELQELKLQLTTATPEKEVLIYISLKRGEESVSEISRKLKKIDISTKKESYQPEFNGEAEEYVRSIETVATLKEKQSGDESLSSESCESILDAEKPMIGKTRKEESTITTSVPKSLFNERQQEQQKLQEEPEWETEEIPDIVRAQPIRINRMPTGISNINQPTDSKMSSDLHRSSSLKSGREPIKRNEKVIEGKQFKEKKSIREVEECGKNIETVGTLKKKQTGQEPLVSRSYEFGLDNDMPHLYNIRKDEYTISAEAAMQSYKGILKEQQKALGELKSKIELDNESASHRGTNRLSENTRDFYQTRRSKLSSGLQSSDLHRNSSLKSGREPFKRNERLTERKQLKENNSDIEET